MHYKLLLRPEIRFDGVSNQSGQYFLSDIPTDETTDLPDILSAVYAERTILLRESDQIVFRVFTNNPGKTAIITSLTGKGLLRLKGVRVNNYTEYKIHDSRMTNDGLYIFSDGDNRHSAKLFRAAGRIMGEFGRNPIDYPLLKSKGLTTSYIISVTEDGYKTLIDTIVLNHDIINYVTHLLSPELLADGFFRAVIRQDGGSYPPGKIIYAGLNVIYSDSAIITSPPFMDKTGVPIPQNDGYALVKRTITPTTTPFVSKIDTVQILSGDNGIMYHDVISIPAIPQEEQIGGNIALLLSGGQKGDGVDLVWKKINGTIIDSVRTDINGDYLFKKVPTQTNGFIYIRFPASDAAERDTAYYGIFHAPLNTIDYVVEEDDTLRTNHNLALTPIWIQDPYTGEMVETEIDDIEELEGGRINSELALYGEENIYLDFDSQADSTWYFNHRTNAVIIMGHDGNNYVSTPRDITGVMQAEYKLRDVSKKHLYGRNMSEDGGGDYTNYKYANDEGQYLHIGYIINLSGDALLRFKEEYFRTMNFQAVDPSNRISVMNPTRPQSIDIPTDKDRIYFTLFKQQRERIINGTAFYRLDFLKESEDF